MEEKLREKVFFTGAVMIIAATTVEILAITGRGVWFAQNVINPLNDITGLYIPTIVDTIGILIVVSQLLGIILLISTLEPDTSLNNGEQP